MLPDDLANKILRLAYLEYISESIISVCGNNIFQIENYIYNNEQQGLIEIINELSVNLWPNCSSYERISNISDLSISQDESIQKIRIKRLSDELHLFTSYDIIEEFVGIQEFNFLSYSLPVKVTYEWKNGKLLKNVNNCELHNKIKLLRKKKCKQCCQLLTEESFLKYMYNYDFINKEYANRINLNFYSICHHCQKENLESENRNFVPNSQFKKKIKRLSRSCANKAYLLNN